MFFEFTRNLQAIRSTIKLLSRVGSQATRMLTYFIKDLGLISLFISSCKYYYSFVSFLKKCVLGAHVDIKLKRYWGITNMVKDKNERITITLTKKQVSWIRTQASKMDITPSRFIKWLLDKNIAKFINRLPERDLQELIRLAKVQWVDFDEDIDD